MASPPPTPTIACRRVTPMGPPEGAFSRSVSCGTLGTLGRDPRPGPLARTFGRDLWRGRCGISKAARDKKATKIIPLLSAMRGADEEHPEQGAAGTLAPSGAQIRHRARQGGEGALRFRLAGRKG